MSAFIRVHLRFQMMSESIGRYLARWFGRQVGHVRGAISAKPDEEKKLYESKVVQEQPHPEDSQVLLRRTTIDEAIVKRDKI